MAAQIYPGEDVYLGDKKIRIVSVDTWCKPYRYYFKDGDSYVYCNRDDLTKRKPKQ